MSTDSRSGASTPTRDEQSTGPVGAARTPSPVSARNYAAVAPPLYQTTPQSIANSGSGPTVTCSLGEYFAHYLASAGALSSQNVANSGGIVLDRLMIEFDPGTGRCMLPPVHVSELKNYFQIKRRIIQ